MEEARVTRACPQGRQKVLNSNKPGPHLGMTITNWGFGQDAALFRNFFSLLVQQGILPLRSQ